MADTTEVSELYDDQFDVGWQSETTENTTQVTSESMEVDDMTSQLGTEAESVDTEGHHGDDEATFDDLDLYDDILTEEDQRDKETYEEMEKKFEAAVATISKLKAENETLHGSVKQLKDTSENAQKNISSILLTARAEMNRKTQEINQLRKQLSKSSFGSHRRFGSHNTSYTASESDTPRRRDLERSCKKDKLVASRIASEKSSGHPQRGSSTDKTDRDNVGKSIQSKSYKDKSDKDRKRKPQKSNEDKSETKSREQSIDDNIYSARKSHETISQSRGHKKERKNSTERDAVKSSEKEDMSKKLYQDDVSEKSNQSQSSRKKSKSKDSDKGRSHLKQDKSDKTKEKHLHSVVKVCDRAKDIERLCLEEKEQSINRQKELLDRTDFKKTKRVDEMHLTDKKSGRDKNKVSSRKEETPSRKYSKSSRTENETKSEARNDKTNDGDKRKPEKRKDEKGSEVERCHTAENKTKVFDLRQKIKAKHEDTEVAKSQRKGLEINVSYKSPVERRTDEDIHEIAPSFVKKVSPHKKRQSNVDSGLESDKLFLSQLFKSAKSEKRSSEIIAKSCQTKEVDSYNDVRDKIGENKGTSKTDRNMINYSDVENDFNSDIGTSSTDIKLSNVRNKSEKSDLTGEKADVNAKPVEEKLTNGCDDKDKTDVIENELEEKTDENSGSGQNTIIDKDKAPDELKVDKNLNIVSQNASNLRKEEKGVESSVDNHSVTHENVNSDNTKVRRSTRIRTQETKLINNEIASNTPTVSPLVSEKRTKEHDNVAGEESLKDVTCNGDMSNNYKAEGNKGFCISRSYEEGNNLGVCEKQTKTSRRKSSETDGQKLVRGVFSETISSVTSPELKHIDTDLSLTSMSKTTEVEKLSPNRFCGKLNCKMKVNHLHPKVAINTSPLKGKNLCTSPNQDSVDNSGDGSNIAKEMSEETKATDSVSANIENVLGSIPLSPETMNVVGTKESEHQRENLFPEEVSMNSGSSGSFGSNILSERTKSPESLYSSDSSDSSDSEYTDDSEYETAHSVEPGDQSDDRNEVKSDSCDEESENVTGLETETEKNTGSVFNNIETYVPESDDAKRGDVKNASNINYTETCTEVQKRSDADNTEQMSGSVVQSKTGIVTEDKLPSIEKKEQTAGHDLFDRTRCDDSGMFVENSGNESEILKDRTTNNVHEISSKETIYKTCKDKDETEKIQFSKKTSPDKRQPSVNNVRSILTESPDKSFLLQSLLCGVESVIETKQYADGESSQIVASNLLEKSESKIDNGLQQKKKNDSKLNIARERELLEADLFGPPLSSDSSDNSSSSESDSDSESGSTNSSSNSCSCSSCECEGSSASSASSSSCSDTSTSDSRSSDSGEQNDHRKSFSIPVVQSKSVVNVSKNAEDTVGQKNDDDNSKGNCIEHESESMDSNCSIKDSSNKPEFCAKEISPCVLKISRQQKFLQMEIKHDGDMSKEDDTEAPGEKGIVKQTDQRDSTSQIESHKRQLNHSYSRGHHNTIDGKDCDQRDNIVKTPDPLNKKLADKSARADGDNCTEQILPFSNIKSTIEKDNQLDMGICNDTSSPIEKQNLLTKNHTESKDNTLTKESKSKLNLYTDDFVKAVSEGKKSDQVNKQIPANRIKKNHVKDQSNQKKLSGKKTGDTVNEESIKPKEIDSMFTLCGKDIDNSSSVSTIKANQSKEPSGTANKSNSVSHSESDLKNGGDNGKTEKQEGGLVKRSISKEKNEQSNTKKCVTKELSEISNKKPKIDSKVSDTDAVMAVSKTSRLSPERALRAVTSFNLESYKIPKRKPVCTQHSSRRKPVENKSAESSRSKKNLTEKAVDKPHRHRNETSKSNNVKRPNSSSEAISTRASVSNSERYSTRAKTKPALSKEFISTSESETDESLATSDSEETADNGVRLVEAIFGKSGSSAESQKSMKYTDLCRTRSSEDTNDIVKDLVKETEIGKKTVVTRKRVRKISSDTESESGVKDNESRGTETDLQNGHSQNKRETGKDFVSPRTHIVQQASKLVSELIESKSDKRQTKTNQIERTYHMKQHSDSDQSSQKDKLERGQRHELHGESKTRSDGSGSEPKARASKVTREESDKHGIDDTKSDNSKEGNEKKSDINNKKENKHKAPKNTNKKSKSLDECSVVENGTNKTDHVMLKNDKHKEVEFQSNAKKGIEKNSALTLDIHAEETLDFLDCSEDMSFGESGSDSDSRSESGSSSSCSSSEEGEISDSDTEQIQFKRSPTKPFKLFQENPASPNKITVRHGFNTKHIIGVKFSPIKFPPSPSFENPTSEGLDMDSSDQHTPRRTVQSVNKRKYASDSTSDTELNSSCKERRSACKSARKHNSQNRRKRSVSIETKHRHRKRSRSPRVARNRSRSYSPRHRHRSKSFSPKYRRERMDTRKSKNDSGKRAVSPRRQRSSSRDSCDERRKLRSTPRNRYRKERTHSNSDSYSERADRYEKHSRHRPGSRQKSPHTDRELSDKTDKETRLRFRESSFRGSDSCKKRRGMIEKKQDSGHTDKNRSQSGESELDKRKPKKALDRRVSERLNKSVTKSPSRVARKEREVHSSKSVRRDHSLSDSEQLGSRAKQKKRKHFRSSTDYETDSDHSFLESESTPVVKRVRKDV